MDGLVQFLIDDHTNWREYDMETYNCMDYAIDLVANARNENLKAWMVGVYFYDQETVMLLWRSRLLTAVLFMLNPRG